MARKKQETEPVEEVIAPILDQPITETIEKNYMPYVMSVIISRAIPEIDGFKPSHRKILYTMYKMGLMNGPRTKSANIVGQTMHLNPHGDASIYDTMVRLTRGNQSLLHPFIDSKGSFGKQYSTNMAYAASRYTEAKLDGFCAEIFRGIDKNAVDMIPNYDNSTTEPRLLPTSFPNILVSPNMGIAVGIASKICSFNLAEVCDGTIEILKNPHVDVDRIMEIIKAPDFPGGGYVLYDKEEFTNIYKTGHGNFVLRAKYKYDPKANCIDILEIPYSTSIEKIMDKIGSRIKENKLKEITDYRDEIDLSGFKLTLDIKKGTDPDALMAKLYRLTPLEDRFACNFNVLIDNVPRQLGIIDILKEWIKFRKECVTRELNYDLQKKQEKLHLLLGLAKILLDIDKAVKIVRNTQNDRDVIPNLMSGFDIDKTQAEFIAEIKLRNFNKEYILNRINEIEGLKNEIDEIEQLLGSEKKMRAYIANQLRDIKNKYGKPRLTEIIYPEDIVEYEEDDTPENYDVKLVFTKEGYFKKITASSFRDTDEQKMKEDDEVQTVESSDNLSELMFMTNKGQCYKARTSAFDTTRSSVMGTYIPSKLSFDPDEKAIFMHALSGYPADKNLIFIFENGKGVKIPLSAYETKGNRKKLTGAFSTASPIAAVFYESEITDILMISDDNKALQISTSLIPVKSTRTSQGVTLFTLKKNKKVVKVIYGFKGKSISGKSYRKIKIPSAGSTFDDYDINENQIKLV